MRKTLVISALLISVGIACLWLERKASANAGSAVTPAYTADGELILPSNYRDWVFLTSGFGMNYSNAEKTNPMFTNVFVSPEAYRAFQKDAKWPDKSMFVVEIYSPASHGSINKSGYYQDAFMALDVEVKDSSRKEQWSYYNFDPGDKTAKALGSGCNSCHTEHAAVENTFVQFYPTLLRLATEKNAIKPGVVVR